jgi:hypothetical protein
MKVTSYKKKGYVRKNPFHLLFQTVVHLNTYLKINMQRSLCEYAIFSVTCNSWAYRCLYITNVGYRAVTDCNFLR